MGYVLFTPNEFQLLPIVLDNSTDESLFPLHLHFVDEIVSKYQDAAHWYLLKIEGTKYSKTRKFCNIRWKMKRRFIRSQWIAGLWIHGSPFRRVAPRSMPNAVLMAARFQFRTSPLPESSNNMRNTSSLGRSNPREEERKRGERKERVQKTFPSPSKGEQNQTIYILFAKINS